jgi:hypothetical protein
MQNFAEFFEPHGPVDESKPLVSRLWLLDCLQVGCGTLTHVYHRHLNLGQSWEVTVHQLSDNVARCEARTDKGRPQDKSGVDSNNLGTLVLGEGSLKVPCCFFGKSLTFDVC